MTRVLVTRIKGLRNVSRGTGPFSIMTSHFKLCPSNKPVKHEVIMFKPNTLGVRNEMFRSLIFN